MAKAYFNSPFLELGYGWITRPDTKYNKDGLFKAPSTGDASDPLVQDFKAKIDAEVEAAFERYVKEKGLTPGQVKKLNRYYPYEELEDDQGDKTGRIRFDFKQNAKLKLRDGTTKEVLIGVKDAKNNDVHKPVFSGSIIRVRYAFRDVFIAATNEVGVRLDFAMVQVKSLKQGGGGGFDEIEDGYVEEDDEGGSPSQTSGGDAPDSEAY